MNFKKVNYFSIFNNVIKKIIKHFTIFGYVMENELENNLLIFIFFKFIKIIRNKLKN